MALKYFANILFLPPMSLDIGELAALAQAKTQLASVWVLNYYHTHSTYELARDLIILSYVLGWLTNILRLTYAYGLWRSIKNLYRYTAKRFYKKTLELPFLKKKVASEVDHAKHELEKSLIVKAKTSFNEVPEFGLTEKEVFQKLEDLNNIAAANWKGGKLSGAVYHGGDELIDLQSKAYHKFAVANQLHPDAFPGVRQMEAEVVSMVLKLFNAPSTGCGTTTSGGTESLLLACLAAREKARHERGLSEFEIIAPKTVHAAIFKAALYFKMKLHLVDLDENYIGNITQVKRLINRNTCLLIGSAPNFPHGLVDNIEELSKLAVKHNIPLHVDCCLGSFVIAYYEKAFQSSLKPFDFRLPGVTSISCDTHKYGFAPKGSSIIMYRSNEYRKYQYFVSTEWVGGLYGSPTLAGSRPGALTVGAWATMVYMGDDGYTRACQDIILTARRLRQTVDEEIPELEIIGDPQLSVVSFKSSKLNIHKLGDRLGKDGWHLSALQDPPALHLAVTKLTVPAIDRLLEDLKVAVKEVSLEDNTTTSDTAQLYGVANSLQTGSVADKLITCFLDTLYKTEPST
ncbi:hypothetical protein OGAPHI_003079 [Ogataea philodendri]|uniref:sphinganine-1-phosphate aldolase n=1 Tax=Ogataea philodendri TaxID=1378263 RepID=A0A9P8T6T4_9ASCO|nr:uncharacterized protein OGAPHI_003079 [Ogataea philodendri]KAH3667430.1 hypothetical protein OGAPHI_003079 [Ogataea philodendri]